MTSSRWAWVALVLLFSRSPQLEAPRRDGLAPIKRVPGRLPFSFEPNVGQAPPGVDFVAHRGGAVFLFSSTGVHAASASGSLELRLLGAASVPGEGEQKLPGVGNYFLGEEPAKWRTHVPTYARVVFRNVYPFVDLVWHSERGELEFDFVLHPGADLSRVRLASAVGVEAPVFFQEGRRLEGQAVAMEDGALAFEVDYDRSAQLVIDPVLAWSTYLGGNADDYSYAIAVDGSGSALVTGPTYSPNFPTLLALQPAHGGGFADAFVTKLSPSGTSLAWSTYLGGSGSDTGRSIAVDVAGNAYVLGFTDSTNFPTQSPLQSMKRGNSDAFVTKLAASGALVYSTYLGGSGDEGYLGIAVDGAGSAYVTGSTDSTDFPTQSPLQAMYGGGFSDAFVAKLSVSGASLAWSTYLGGSGGDYGSALAVDGAGSAHVTGYTTSTNFPTQGALQPAFGGGLHDAFVTKLSASGASLAWSTYLGGNSGDYGYDVAVDGAGNAYVTGYTGSTNFPTQSPLQPGSGGGVDVFVSKLSVSGASLAWSTFLGGGDDDVGYSIAVDEAGSAYVTGDTLSTNFPTQSPLQPLQGGGADTFVTRLSPSGAALTWSTYLGGTGDDHGRGIAANGGRAFVAGYTGSTNFPTQTPLQPVPDGGWDSLVLALADDAGAADSGVDGGVVDGGAGDGGVVDGGGVDGGGGDGGGGDGGGVDGGGADGGGVDGGGVDGGAVDGGAVDGGAVDGGAVDGGAVDGGGSAQGDAGEPDSGTALDGGDGGAEGPGARSYQVGCGCSSAPEAWLAGLAVLSRFARRRRRDSESI